MSEWYLSAGTLLYFTLRLATDLSVPTALLTVLGLTLVVVSFREIRSLRRRIRALEEQELRRALRLEV